MQLITSWRISSDSPPSTSECTRCGVSSAYRDQVVGASGSPGSAAASMLRTVRSWAACRSELRLLAEHAADQRVHDQAFAGRVELGQAVLADQAHRGLEPAFDADGPVQLGRQRQAAGRPEQLPGDRRAGQEGAQLEQLRGGRRGAPQRVRGQAPGHPDRGREGQLGFAPVEAAQVFVDRPAGRGPDRRGLFQRDRHVAQALGEPVGVRRRTLPGYAGAGSPHCPDGRTRPPARPARPPRSTADCAR